MLGNLEQTILDNLFEGVYIVDIQRQIRYWNRAAEQITGFSRDEITGRSCFDGILQHIDEKGRRLCFGGCPLHETLRDGNNRQNEIYLHHKDGHRIPVSVRVTPLRNDDGEVIGAMEMFRDAGREEEQRRRIESLEKMAFVDALTGLPNRRFLMTQIESRLDELRRYDWPFGLLFIDVDYFKAINDSHGHDVGDAVLTMVASTLKASIRGFDFLARYGGEEFVVVLSNVNRDHLMEIAERFRMLVSLSSLREPEDISVTVSIGAAMAVASDTAETLIKRADQKLYEAKRAGRNSVFS